MLADQLEKLFSLAERQAVAQAVAGQLLPRPAMVDLYAKLATEARDMDEPGAATPAAVREQAAWVIQSLRSAFLHDAHRMVDWTHRLRLSQPTADWDPGQWVACARDLDAGSDLTAMVIEHAPALSWPSWWASMVKVQDWPAQWTGWERTLVASPSTALRWLDLLISHPPATPGQNRMSFCRGRLWQQIQAANAAGRPFRLLEQIDARLEGAGADRELSCVDYSMLLRDRHGALLDPSSARKSLARFWASCPGQSGPWLADASPPPAAPQLQGPSSARRGQSWLSWLALEGRCSSSALRLVLAQWAQCLGDDGWKSVLPAIQAVEPKAAGKTRKTKRAPTASRTAPAPPQAPSSAGSPGRGEPLEAIPRFPTR